MMRIDSSLLAIMDGNLYYFLDGVWVRVLKVKVLENRGDIAIDYKYDGRDAVYEIKKRDKPLKKGWSRFLPSSDMMFLELEIGIEVALEMTPNLYKLASELYKIGFISDFGPDCSETFIQRIIQGTPNPKLDYEKKRR